MAQLPFSAYKQKLSTQSLKASNGKIALKKEVVYEYRFKGGVPAEHNIR